MSCQGWYKKKIWFIIDNYSEIKQKRKFCTFGSPNLVKSVKFRFSLPFACCIKFLYVYIYFKEQLSNTAGTVVLRMLKPWICPLMPTLRYGYSMAFSVSQAGDGEVGYVNPAMPAKLTRSALCSSGSSVKHVAFLHQEAPNATGHTDCTGGQTSVSCFSRCSETAPLVLAPDYIHAFSYARLMWFYISRQHFTLLMGCNCPKYGIQLVITFFFFFFSPNANTG